jgi:PAS domain S-box-containing protein
MLPRSDGHEEFTMNSFAGDTLFRAIVESTPDAIIYADAAGMIRLWNAGAVAMFGYTAGEAIGQTLDLIIPERLRTRHWDGYRRVMQTGESHYGPGEMLAVPAVNREGARLSVEFSIAMLRTPDGHIEGIVAILRDITTRWQLERDLRSRIAALEAAQKAAEG